MPAWLTIAAAFIAGAVLVYLIGVAARGGSSTGGAASGTVASGTPSPPAPGDGPGRAPEAPGTGASPARSPATPTTGRVNLLSSANGGHLMAAPDDSWRYAIDDDTNNWQYIQAGSGDGVYTLPRSRPQPSTPS